MGYPLVPYDPEIGELICEELAAGKSLKYICDLPGVPSQQTVLKWAINDAGPGFREQYAHARDIGLDIYVMSLREVSADRARDPRCRQVEIDAIKWIACKLLPKRYGDKLEHSGKIEIPKIIFKNVIDEEPAEK